MVRASQAFRVWPSIVTALLSGVILLGTMVVLIVAVLAVTHKMPDGPVALQWLEAAGYLATAAYLLRRLPHIAARSLGELGLRAPAGDAWKTFGIALAALTVVSLANSAIMRALHVHHVQAGFEGFFPDVVRHLRAGSGEAIATFALTVVLVAVIAPFTEELFFRGFLFRALSVRMPWIAAALISSLLFGLVHGDMLLLGVLVAFGCVNAWAYRRSGNLVVPMLAHGTFNFAFVVLGIAGAALQR